MYLSMMEASFAVGMLAGGLIIGAWGGFKSRVMTIAISMMATGILTIAIGIPITFWLYCTWMFLCGIVLPGVNTPAVTIIQLSTDEQYMGRIFSVVNMIGIAAMPLAMVIFGPLSDRVPIDAILVGTGLAIVLIGIVLLRDRRARALEPSAADLLD